MKPKLLVMTLTLIMSWSGHQHKAYGSQSDVCSTVESGQITSVGGNPESALFHQGQAFVSNMGEGARDEKDDGYISLLGTEGQVIDKKWLPLKGDQLDSPLGMAVLGRTLYVADINRIAAFDLDTRKALPAIDLSSTGATFLNDVVAGDSPYLYVSATAIKKVFRVNTVTGEFESITDDKPGFLTPNGLAWSSEKAYLYIAQNQIHSLPTDGLPNGNILVLDTKAKDQVVATSPKFGNFIDGITLTDDGEFLVSDWNSFTDNGLLYHVDASLKVTGSESIASNGFADFDSDSHGKCIIAPDLLKGQVVFSSR